MVILCSQKRACDMLNLRDKEKISHLFNGSMSLAEVGKY
jgi:hypothetical protein